MRNDKYFLYALDKIKEILNKINFKGSVYLFGSSVTENYLDISDMDIAVVTPQKKLFTLLKYELEELNIPYKIDLTNLEEAGEKLKKEILKSGVLIWKN